MDSLDYLKYAVAPRFDIPSKIRCMVWTTTRYTIATQINIIHPGLPTATPTTHLIVSTTLPAQTRSLSFLLAPAELRARSTLSQASYLLYSLP